MISSVSCVFKLLPDLLNENGKVIVIGTAGTLEYIPPIWDVEYIENNGVLTFWLKRYKYKLYLNN